MTFNNIFCDELKWDRNYAVLLEQSQLLNQSQTNEAFSSKWVKLNRSESDVESYTAFQKNWYLKLYGFDSESGLAEFLRTKKIILDAGCGLGPKAAWFATLAPESIVLGMDFSEAAFEASNLYFVRGDIAATGLKSGSIDYISCDQVIHHTEVPEETFAHLASLLSEGGEFACYVYAKHALPRELVDDFFRLETHKLSEEQLWEMSEQLTELGKRLSALEVSFDCPDVPLLGIKGGNIDIQRFIYWNFLKCFWKKEWSDELCNATNFDWYAPSNAKRYSEEEYRQLIGSSELEIIHFHGEEACYSGRFRR